MLVLKGSEIGHLLNMSVAIGLVEQVLKDYSLGRAHNGPRTRVHTHHPWVFAALPGATPSTIGAQLWLSPHEAGAPGPTKPGSSEVNILLSLETGKPLAMLLDCFLNPLRTGAAGAVGIKYLAPEDVQIAGVFGSNKNARTQLEGAVHVRSIKKALVYSPNTEHKVQFANEMSDLLKVPVVPAATPDEVVKSADLIISATASREPVFDGNRLRPGMHINSISNGDRGRTRAEIDEITFRRSDLIFVTHKDTIKVNHSDVWRMAEKRVIDWDRVNEIGDLIGGKVQGRTNEEQITLFKPQGMGMWDIAILEYLYKEAKKSGIGREI